MNFETQLINKKILIVDDDQSLNSSIRDILINAGFSNIVSAYTVKEGADIFLADNIDLILLDVMLPDGEGYILAEYVRKISDIPILFLTAKNNPEDEIKGLQSGGDDYVTKPFLPKILIYRIVTLLRRAYKFDTDIIELKDCKINFGNATVEKNGAINTMTPTEIQIIRKLYANKNYIVSSESICDAVWGLESFGYEKALMVHIRNIREKIEQNPSKPVYIVTVKGLGYKMMV